MFTLTIHEAIDEMLKEHPQVRETTRGLLANFVMDLPLTPSQCQDFGIDSPNHYRALRQAVWEAGDQKGVVPSFVELDEALGNGAALTKLVRTYLPGCDVTFHTVWDDTYDR